MNRTSVGCTERCFTVAPGRSQTVKFTFTRSTAALNPYAGGQLTWSDGTHKVRIWATKYLGSVADAGEASATNPTIVRVDMP